jgi:hypothetical protein
MSDGLKLLRVAEVIHPISPSPAMVLRLRLPIPLLVHGTHRHSDGSRALRTRNEEW